MSKTETWRRPAKDAAYAYPRLRRELAELRSMSVTPKLSGMPRGGGASRSVEDAALRQLPPGERAAFEAVDRALRLLRVFRTAEKRRRLVEMVYFRQSHTIYGAGAVLEVSEVTARQWNRDFLLSVYTGLGKN